MSNDHQAQTVTGATDSRLPERPSLEGLETRWGKRWDEQGTYVFDRTKARAEVFSIDTPPPTVSGELHIGHVFSYTQTDVVARFQRMLGKEVFYPIGWDDNGLPTERRVQNHFGVHCDPTMAYERDLELSANPTSKKDKRETCAVSRPNFIELCHVLTDQDEKAFAELFRLLGLSVDWKFTYTTIGERTQRASQRGFLHLVGRGHAYRQEAPTLWDVDFQSAVAQAELEDREIAGAYHRIAFAHSAEPDKLIPVDTTRPELLPACVALVAHPEDSRYAPFFGTSARTPLFQVDVPILAHPLADPEKGTGIAMVCTFGDLTDVTWWRELGLSTRTVIGRDGRLEPVAFGSLGWESSDPDHANAHYRQLQGRTVRQAQREIVEQLRTSGALLQDPRPITHPVKFYERGERPLEIVSSRQWYVRTISLREQLLTLGRELDWHPEFMQARFEAWVEGLNGDWNISRQRFFGVPFPVWYPIDEDGGVSDAPIFASEDRLPVDPSTDVPDGYLPEQRGHPGGFVGDPDVFDTWATSSLTPQIAGGWEEDPDLFDRVFPMDLRPQAHEIIRTWLFSTVVRSYYEHGTLPWQHAAISGWILDPDRKKMSKSKGNVVTPTELLKTHGTDAVRYWAVSARLGADTIFDEQQMKIGRRLGIKILNAAKFVLSRCEEFSDTDAAVTAPLDAALLVALEQVVEDATRALSDYEHARALERIEQFFWTFCDDYLELVKGRAYGTSEHAASARCTLRLTLDVVLRLLAPYLPFVTEEAWSWWHDGSIHRSPWPTTGEIATMHHGGAPSILLDEVGTALSEIRRAKTIAKRSMRAGVARAIVSGPEDVVARVALASSDLCDAGTIARLDFTSGGESLAVEVELEQEQQSA